jgi:integrase
MPLPPDVGKAIAAYLQKDRPACLTRRLFIRLQAPRRGFANSEAISTIVARVLKKAGIDSPYTGADIAQLLRHQSFNTTTLYAKVDLTALQTLAQRWPGGVQ